ncbi:MAG TPA: Fic family protein [Luteimonas sp.]|nr:Fic family protein [Luteimonas sp.]HRO26078.1 Fic family protein [Luteimonas sp.]HRP72481.1 Fic family protein [Luteimonas sp.]
MKLPVKAPQLSDLLGKDGFRLADLLGRGIGPEVDSVYDHWDHVRHLSPPAGLDSASWWAGIKLARAGLERTIPLADKVGHPFTLSLTGNMQRQLHFLDREAAGAIQASGLVDEGTTRKRYLMRSLIEEAMTSSQLEGASTTRQVAKEMLSTGRAPRDRSEQMIHNNYAMMQSLRRRQGRPLTVDLILEIHRELMHDTMDDATQAGRLRTAEDNVVVQDRLDPGIVLHVPPRAAELPQRLQALCDFANAEGEGEFLHPIVRAIAIHFQIGYDHPFCDGNGRTARALFYWSMLRAGYWLSEYISISSVLKKAPAPYIRSYLYTESDGTDMTYFVAHQLDVIIDAVEGLRGYLARKGKERSQAESLLRPGSPLGALLNHRQRALLLHAIRNPDSVYDIAGHQASHRITYPTARSDLLGLVELGLLDQDRRGKAFVFTPASDMTERLKR